MSLKSKKSGLGAPAGPIFDQERQAEPLPEFGYKSSPPQVRTEYQQVVYQSQPAGGQYQSMGYQQSQYSQVQTQGGVYQSSSQIYQPMIEDEELRRITERYNMNNRLGQPELGRTVVVHEEVIRR